MGGWKCQPWRAARASRVSSVTEDDERDKTPLPQQKERGSEGDGGCGIGKDTKDAAEISGAHRHGNWAIYKAASLDRTSREGDDMRDRKTRD
jgi:hypothetical protein